MARVYELFWTVLALAAISHCALGFATKRTVPNGFVTTNGKDFELDGKPFVRYTLSCEVERKILIGCFYRTSSVPTLTYVSEPPLALYLQSVSSPV